MKKKAISESSLWFMCCKLIIAPLFVPLQPHDVSWNWAVLNTEDITVSANFLWGVSLSEYQNSGAERCVHSNWAFWEQQDNVVRHNQKSGVACDFWNLYLQDIDLAKDLGMNAMRISVEWSLIEPQEGCFDEQVLKHYHDVIDALINSGIMPMVTLYHFSHPQWFEKKQAFEDEDNIHYFIRYSKKIFDALSDKVSLWCTINEPSIYAFQGYVRGVFPPGCCDVARAGIVLKNLLKAHCDTYTTLKKCPRGSTAQIGLAHQHLLFEPFNKDNLLESMIAWYLSHIASTAVLDFFKMGNFEFYAFPLFNNFFGKLSIPHSLYTTIKYHDPEAPRKLDFIGLNYYSRVLLSLKHPTVPAYLEHDIKTDMPYSFYPEGLYKAIQDMSKFNVPIYITENGIADAHDDRRELFLKRHAYVLSKALRDGYDVRGYFYWTLIDNFEWDEGYEMKFGLYKKEQDTNRRECRNSALALKNIIQKSKNFTV